MPNLADKRALGELKCKTCEGPTFNLGLETYRVPFALHELNRLKVVEAVLPALGEAKAVVLLQGGEQATRYDTDHEVRPFL